MVKSIGLIGTGSMGKPIGINLLASGYRLRIYNRTAAKASTLTEKGAMAASLPHEAGETGGIVITMLSDDQALKDVAISGDALAARLGRGGVHISMSTVSPETSRLVAAHHQKFGVSYVSAPVFGRPDAAVARKLWICISGDAGAKSRIRPILSILSQGMFDFGDDPGAANVVKLGGNFLIASAIESLGEVLALAEKNGIPRATLIGMLNSSLFSCPAYQTYGQKLAAETYSDAGFKLVLGLKDINLVLQTAESAEVNMPVARLIRERLEKLRDADKAEWDWSALGLLASEEARLR